MQLMKTTNILWLISLLGVTGSLFAFNINKHRTSKPPYYIGTSPQDACNVTWTRGITTNNASDPIYFFTLVKGQPCNLHSPISKGD